MTLTQLRSSLAALALTALPAAALAHPGLPGPHAHGFTDGFVHPFTGLDHLVAMLVVGAWSACGTRRAWVAPLAFLACLLAGALATAHGLAVPGVEPMIAFSLLALGLLLAHGTTLAPLAAAALVGGFAWFHGAAHGLELGAGAALGGMLLATATLHLAGLAAGIALRRHSAWWARGAGLAVAASGLSLLAS
jgi:urease accessory protein